MAYLALFLALGGSALAAKHYLITSTAQIRPRVLKSLRASSSAVVARARSTAPLVSGSGPVRVAVALRHASWTQRPGELELVLAGATVTDPSAPPGPQGCTSVPGTVGELQTSVRVDGRLVGSSEFTSLSGSTGAPPPGVPREIDLLRGLARGRGPAGPASLLEPAVATRHVVEVTVRDNCAAPAGSAAGHFTIDSVAVDVVGVK